MKSNKETVRRLYVDEGRPASEICRIMAGRLSRTSISRYIFEIHRGLSEEEHEQLWVRRTSRPEAAKRRTRSYAEQPSLSPLHVRIGAKISWHRGVDASEPQQYASKHKWCNRQSLRAMEQGLYDFSLIELQKIAKTLETDVPTLIAPL